MPLQLAGLLVSEWPSCPEHKPLRPEYLEVLDKYEFSVQACIRAYGYARTVHVLYKCMYPLPFSLYSSVRTKGYCTKAVMKEELLKLQW